MYDVKILVLLLTALDFFLSWEQGPVCAWRQEGIHQRHQCRVAGCWILHKQAACKSCWHSHVFVSSCEHGTFRSQNVVPVHGRKHEQHR